MLREKYNHPLNKKKTLYKGQSAYPPGRSDINLKPKQGEAVAIYLLPSNVNLKRGNINITSQMSTTASAKCRHTYVYPATLSLCNYQEDLTGTNQCCYSSIIQP